jgi:biopolymer transport protein ExbD
MALGRTPQINGASMADIAFIILAFFLMVTTMGGEFGLIRQLPPWVDPSEQEGDKINQRNVFVVAISKDDNMLVRNEYKSITDLRAMAKEFFDINNVGDNFPEKEMQDLPLLGPTLVNKTAIASLQNDRGTSYKIYIQAQHELAGAINELRDEFCMQRFGRKFDDCTEEQRDVVGGSIYKMAISEAEPKDVSNIQQRRR